MKISSFDVEQRALSSFSRMTKSEASIHVFKVETPIAPPNQLGLGELPIELSLSEEGLNAKETELDTMFHLSEEDKAKIRLLETLLSALTGKRFKFQQVVKMDEGSRGEGKSKASESNGKLAVKNTPQNTRSEIGIRITAKHEVFESEQMSFRSEGVVKTSDGREIQFAVNLNMARSYYESSDVLIEMGAKLQDPLVINFDGKGVAFGEDSIELDITLDGTAERFRNLAQGSGFLVMDKNGNGEVDDGSELFGPQSGNGFAELSAYDEDGNGWIDESDTAFGALKIWTVSPDGQKTMIGLKEADVGAIYLGSVASDYHVKNGDELIAKIRETSVYLKETGGAGTLHMLDLKI